MSRTIGSTRKVWRRPCRSRRCSQTSVKKMRRLERLPRSAPPKIDLLSIHGQHTVPDMSFRKFGAVMLVVCGTAVSGCVPMMGHYYEPSASNGSVSREACHGKVGALSDIYITRGTRKILIASDYSSATSVAITVQFSLTHDDHAEIRWSDLKLLDAGGNRIPFTIPVKSGYNIPATKETIASLDDEEIADMDGNRFEFYELTMTITGDIPDNFTLVVPSMVVNSVDYPSSNVGFKKAFGLWIFPINC